MRSQPSCAEQCQNQPLWASLDPGPPSASQRHVTGHPGGSPCWHLLLQPTGSSLSTLVPCQLHPHLISSRTREQGSSLRQGCFWRETAAWLSSQRNPTPKVFGCLDSLGEGLQDWHPQTWVQIPHLRTARLVTLGTDCNLASLSSHLRDRHGKSRTHTVGSRYSR